MQIPRRLAPALLLFLLVGAGAACAPADRPGESGEAVAPPATLVIHGGAGTLSRENLTAELEAEYRAKLEEALRTGFAVLEEGGASLDAVEATVRVLEDSPLFNAGKGAVFTAAGSNELDASIMDGATGRAGAVTGVTRIRNPITAARAVMERTPHVLLAGAGAEALAAEAGLALVEPDYFFTERRWEALERARERAGEPPVEDPEGRPRVRAFGTVGAVALDREGRLAAATSTGGLTNKRSGRIGDSPIPGAGTWADGHCAVSGTGHGESFMLHLVAYDICARLAYRSTPIDDAAREVIDGVLGAADAAGGVIVLDHDGAFDLVFNTSGMYRGWMVAGEEPHTAIFADE